MSPEQFAAMINGQPQAPGAAPPQPPFAAAIQGQQSPLIPSPTQDPMVIQQRASKFNELAIRLATDQNLQQALLFAGSSMLQPPQWGDTTGSILGRGVALGASAYNLGEMAEQEQALRQREEQRKQTESQARVAQAQATTEGQVLANETARQTQDAKIAQANTLAEQTAFDLQKARRVEDVEAVKRKYEERKQQVLATIPDATLRQSIEAEFRKAEEANRLLRAQTASASASARASSALAKGRELENAGTEALTPAERAEILRRRHGQGKTGLEAGAEVFGKLYDAMHAGKPTDPAARAKFIDERLSKQMDPNKLMLEFTKALGDPEAAREMVDRLRTAPDGTRRTELATLPGQPAVLNDADEQYLRINLPEGQHAVSSDGLYVVYKLNGKLMMIRSEEWRKARGNPQQ